MSQQYDFFSRFARIFNSGQSRSVMLSGNIYDLYWDGESYQPLIPFLCTKSRTDGLVQLVFELNGPIRVTDEDRAKLKDAWAAWKGGADLDTLRLRELHRKGSNIELYHTEFEQHLRDAVGNSTQALEFLRQITICSRAALRENLLIFVEAADMLLPAGNGDLAAMNDRQLRRISIVQDWFSDPEFLEGGDSVCLVAESRSLIHPRIAQLPQVLSVDVPAPNHLQRAHYIETLVEDCDPKPKLEMQAGELAASCAGLSNHAIRQLLVGAAYANEALTTEQVIPKVEEFIKSQLGEDVVEFKKPEHSLDDVVGNTGLKEFLHQELIPRFQASGDAALPGAAVAGPIGGGKTFIFEAVAGALGMPVLVLKNIRSQWFGQTDVIFERLRRVLMALEKVVIFVDEADTQFGQVGAEAHTTERRLTGKIQAMMSDPRLRGKVLWLLMTARIHLLSPDIRRPGRVGDLIIPVLDPRGDDRLEFIRWVLAPISLQDITSGVELDELVARMDREWLDSGYSAAAFAMLRSQVRAKQPETSTELEEIIRDLIPPAIGQTRRYQTLQAMINCTRRSLLPDPTVGADQREQWHKEIRTLELAGIS